MTFTPGTLPTHKAYAVSFIPGINRSRITWTRYGIAMESTLALAKKVALVDYPFAHSFLIQDPEQTF